MFVETRTAAEEVKADMLRELEFMANGLLSQLRTVRSHPSFVTMKLLREEGDRFAGALRLVRMVYGDNFPEESEAKFAEAIAANRAAIAIKKGR